jgi:hypothetical protein
VSTEIVYPKADIAGSWELNQPLPVDGSVYTEPKILGVDSAGYQGNDSASAAAILNALQLPDVGIAASAITLVGGAFGELVDDNVFRTSHTVPLPAVTIVAGDIIEVKCSTQELSDPGDPALATYTKEYSLHDGVAYRPHVTKFWKVAVGGESGNLTVTSSSTRMTAVSKVYRGVDNTTPYDAAAVVSYGNNHPDPASITTVTDGAVVQCDVTGNLPTATPSGTQSAGFIVEISQIPDARAFFDCVKVKAVAGAENPAAYSWPVDNSTAVTHALRPAAGSDVTAWVITSVADGTATAELGGGSAPTLTAVNEKQQIVSVLTSGTFTLTYAGQTTASINWNDTAATVQTRLEALSNIGVGDVTCTVGPLNNDPVIVEFTGALAATDVALMTASSGSVTVTQTARGRALETFTLATSFNIPRGAADEPQIHVWTLDVADYVAGDQIDITVADHGTLHTWAAALVIEEGGNTTTPVDVVGAETSGAGTFATWGAVTPVTAGARIFGVFSKADLTHYAGLGHPSASSPARYLSAVEAAADAMTLNVFTSAPVDIVAETPSSVSWGGGTEDYATGVLAIRPAAAASGSGLFNATNAADETTWIEIAQAAGAMYEVLEFDLGALPPDAVITSAFLEFAHAAAVTNPLRVVLVGINTDSTILPADELQVGYSPTTGQTETVVTNSWAAVADGSLLSSFTRLGVALISSDRHPLLESHKVFWVRASIEFEEGGPVVDSVIPPTNAGDPIAWTYSSVAGLPQTHYQIKAMRGTNQDPTLATTPTDDLTPDVGEHILDTGLVPGALVQSVTFSDRALGRAFYTYAVRAASRLPSGLLITSDWTTANADITGSPQTGLNQLDDPVFNPVTGAVDLTLRTDINQIRAWVERSDDSGATYRVIPGSPFTLVASTTDQVVSDYWAPLADVVRYRVAFDNGDHSETSAPKAVGGDSDHSTTHSDWYFIVPDQSALSSVVDVADVAPILTSRRSVTSDQPGASVTATSLPLATRMSLSVRTIGPAARAVIEAILAAGLPVRVVDIFGREWLMSITSGDEAEILIAGPLVTDTTGLRDVHLFHLDLVEVTAT